MSYSGKNPKFRSVVFPDEGATSLSNAPTGAHRLINRNGKVWLKDSAGTETLVSGGAGGTKNYMLNPSAAADLTNIVASGAGVTVTRTTTAAELPRGTTTGTAFKVTGVSGTDYVRVRWTIDEADKGRNLAVIFALRTISGYANGDFKLEVYATTDSSYATGNTELALSTDVSGTSAINVGTTSFGAVFTATTADYYEARLVRVAGTSSFGVSDFTVTPDKASQGAAIGPWQSYTPTFTGLGTVTIGSAKWRQSGSDIEIAIYATAGTPTGVLASFNLPNSWTIDDSVTGVVITRLGAWTRNNSSATAAKRGGIIRDNGASVSLLYFSTDAYTPTSSPMLKQNGNVVIGSSEVFEITAKVPITQLAQSGHVNLISQDNLNNWTTYTPTGGFSGGAYTGRWRRVGDTMEVHASFTSNGSTSGSATFGLPTGYTVDTSKFPTTPVTNFTILQGQCAINFSGSGAKAYVLYSSTTTVQLAYQSSTAGAGSLVTSTAPQTPANGAIYDVVFSVPITEWANQNNTSLCGFLEATSTLLGLVKAPKQYVVGTAYTNGTPALNSGSSAVGMAITRGVLVPYQTVDGAWRMRVNVTGTMTSASGTQDMTLSGFTCKNGYNQAMALITASNTNCLAYAVGNTATFRSSLVAASTTIGFSGDIELDSKPTWAD